MNSSNTKQIHNPPSNVNKAGNPNLPSRLTHLSEKTKSFVWQSEKKFTLIQRKLQFVQADDNGSVWGGMRTMSSMTKQR